eukprot:1158690-Pelagomonas_calceolata.AAC.6
MDGLLTGEQDASLEGWPSTCQIRISLVAPSCALSCWTPVRASANYWVFLYFTLADAHRRLLSLHFPLLQPSSSDYGVQPTHICFS